MLLDAFLLFGMWLSGPMNSPKPPANPPAAQQAATKMPDAAEPAVVHPSAKPEAVAPQEGVEPRKDEEGSSHGDDR